MDRRGFLGCLAAIAGTTVVPIPVVDTVSVKISVDTSYTSQLMKFVKLAMKRNAAKYTDGTYENIVRQMQDIYIQNKRISIR